MVGVRMNTEPLDDDWLEVECTECWRLFRDVHDRDVHMLESHGLNAYQ
jgi:hypothetical protein